MIKKHYPLFSIVLLLINFLVACGTQPSAIAGGNSGKATATLHSQVNCPPVGNGRAAVIIPGAEGSHQAVIYTSNGRGTQQDEGTVNRYDTVTRQNMPIISVPHASIGNARLSADGQWVLFIKSTYKSNVRQNTLQIVRTDGQGLQTVYCTNTQYINDFLSDIYWSPDQRYIAFDEYEDLPAKAGGASLSVVNILNVSAGSITTLYEEAIPGRVRLMGWLDNTHLYIDDYSFKNKQNAEYIGLWDVTKGAPQHVKHLVTVADSEYFVDLAISKDRTKLFVSNCSMSGGAVCNAPSRITVQPVTGTARTAIYASPTLTIRSMQVASSTTLLFTDQIASTNDPNVGLWKIDQDGHNLTHLIKGAPAQLLEIGDLAPDGANVSPDGSMYAVTVNDFETSALEIGTLSGGTPTIALSEKYKEGEDTLGIVGWTKV